jgi:uncharacterized protein (TIGR02145 family)
MDILANYGDCAVSGFTCGNPLGYQGYDYESVLIGEQCWFAENLKTESFSTGEIIPNVTNNSEWLSMDGVGAWCNYENSLEIGELYGKLYNWWAVNDSRGLCPSNWSVAKGIDWEELVEYVGGMSVAGSIIKDEDLWNGGNLVGFSALPSGLRINSQDVDFVNGPNSIEEYRKGAWWDRSYNEIIEVNFDIDNSGFSSTAGNGTGNNNYSGWYEENDNGFIQVGFNGSGGFSSCDCTGNSQCFRIRSPTFEWDTSLEQKLSGVGFDLNFSILNFFIKGIINSYTVILHCFLGQA